MTCENGKEYYNWSAVVTYDYNVLYNKSPKFLTPCDGNEVTTKVTGWWRMDCLDAQGEYYKAYGTLYTEYWCDEDGNRYAAHAGGLEPMERGDCFRVPPSVKEKLKPLIEKVIIDMKIKDTTGRIVQ